MKVQGARSSGFKMKDGSGSTLPPLWCAIHTEDEKSIKEKMREVSKFNDLIYLHEHIERYRHRIQSQKLWNFRCLRQIESWAES